MPLKEMQELVALRFPQLGVTFQHPSIRRSSAELFSTKAHQTLRECRLPPSGKAVRRVCQFAFSNGLRVLRRVYVEDEAFFRRGLEEHRKPMIPLSRGFNIRRLHRKFAFGSKELCIRLDRLVDDLRIPDHHAALTQLISRSSNCLQEHVTAVVPVLSYCRYLALPSRSSCRPQAGLI